MTDYTDAFGSSSIPVADAEYGAYTLTASATFNWPYNYSGAGNIVYKTMEISCTNGIVITMPDADKVSVGETTLIRNVGAETLTVQKSDSSALASIGAGLAVMLYVTDNSTAAGEWGLINYGAGSSSADAMSLAGYGLKAIGTVLNAAYPVETEASGWAVDIYDRAKSIIYTGGTDIAVLPSPSDAGSDWFIMIRNSGTGTLTIESNAAENIDDASQIAFNPGESAIFVSTGSVWYTIGYGRSLLYQFTQLIKDVSAGGTFVLTDAEAGNKLLTFTGNPGTAVIIEVPAVVSIYYINSDISTAQTITVKTNAGSGAAVDQGQRAIVFCDSVDVLAAQTASVSGAVSLEDGSVTTPSLKFATDTDTGLYKVTGGFAGTANGTNIFTADANGFTVAYGYLKLPAATTPSQIAEGGMVWDNDSDLLTVGTGASRKTMCDLDTAQALTNKTLTSPTITSPTLTIKAGTGSTTEGVMEWNTSTDKLLVGTGAATKTLVNSDDVIGIAQGGTGQATQTAGMDALSPTTTKGDLLVDNGTNVIRLAVGTDGQVLQADSGAASGLSYTAIPAAEVTLTGTETLQNKTLTDVNRITYVAEYDNGTMTAVGSKTITWSNGQRQKLTLDGTSAFATTLIFDWTGCGVGQYQLRIIVADGFSYTLSWSTGTPGSTGWLGSSSAPSLYTGAASRSTVFNFFYGDSGFVCGSGNKVGAF